jgi:hypothetical protein
MNDFKLWCGLFNVQGAIDGTNLYISKPFMPFSKDYYYLKYGAYFVVAQAMVDYKKTFTDICVGMPRSVNVSHELHMFVLYK